jgi:hypothetical protein
MILSWNYSMVSNHILILEKVTSVNISRHHIPICQDLVEPKLLLCSPIPQSRRGRQSLWFKEKLLLLVLPMHRKKRAALVLELLLYAFPLLEEPIRSYCDFSPVAFYNVFIG